MEGQPSITTQSPHNSQEAKALLESLDEAIAQRGCHYRKIFAFSIRFEGDNTSAWRDTEHFQGMLKALKLRSAKEVIIKESDKTPSCTVLDIIGDLRKIRANTQERSLVIGHYAGHGYINIDNKLVLCASGTSRRKFVFEWTLGWLCVPGDEDDDLRDIDVVLILDSCFSGQAMRGDGAMDRSVEIIAAVSAEQKALGNPSEVARNVSRTFTSRLATEVAICVGRGDASISFAEIVGRLRAAAKPERQPQYHLKRGRVGVRVPVWKAPGEGFGSERREGSLSESSTFSLSPSVARYRAIFQVHLKDTDVRSAENRNLVNWIHSLHPSIGLEVTGVYEGGSTIILLHAPWHLWAQLSWFPGCSLVCETFGGNRHPEILHQQGPHRLQQ